MALELRGSCERSDGPGRVGPSNRLLLAFRQESVRPLAKRIPPSVRPRRGLQQSVTCSGSEQRSREAGRAAVALRELLAAVRQHLDAGSLHPLARARVALD